jgi:tRNA1Val (adenine37-N6)-methyltransferase
MTSEMTLDSICGIRLYQRKRGYRFSLDSVLLAGFTRITKGRRRVADLGAGSGVLGLVLAVRHPWIRVVMVELQESLCKIASENIVLNGLQERVSVVNADITSIHTGQYPGLEADTFDAVITNPPFRKPGTGRISPLNERAIARHELSMNLDSLVRTSGYLLRNGGRLFIVYHPFRLSELIDIMRSFSFEPKRMRFVHPRRDVKAK